MRRVHRGNGIEDDKGSSAKLKLSQSPTMSNVILQNQHHVSNPLAGYKRKRILHDEEADDPPRQIPAIGDLMQTLVELRDEVKRLKQEVSIRDAVIEQLKRTLHLRPSSS